MKYLQPAGIKSVFNRGTESAGLMDYLTILRIVLTIGAIAGLLPVTLLFLTGTFFLVVGTVGTRSWRELPVELTIIAISTFCLWSIWKIYRLAMSSTPSVSNKNTLIVGVIVTAIWGVIWAVFTQSFPDTTYIFLMPGLTAAVMLAIALKRQVSRATAFASLPALKVDHQGSPVERF
ncbi:hypothetical protein [Pseudomonas sp. McL0111]|uniref:hypothetical protein n=1 Tax=Pseudomonas sp. McL0111 TaxID=3457357 RepID=UPI00403E56A4